MIRELPMGVKLAQTRQTTVVPVAVGVGVVVVSDIASDSIKEQLSSTSVWSFHNNVSSQKRPSPEYVAQSSLTWKTWWVIFYFSNLWLTMVS